MIRPIAFVVVAICALCASADATVPASITVQGRLTDNFGEPIPAGDKAFVFRIFDASTGGIQYWPPAEANGEQQTIFTDANGLWTALLGISHLLNEGAVPGPNSWLEVTVDGTTLPRTRLVSVPYALKVSTVDGAWGGNILSKVWIGPGHSNLGANAFVAGSDNTADGDWSTVAGGQNNVADGAYSSVGGGAYNVARGNYATVGGGGGDDPADSNAALANHTTIGGGSHNLAIGAGATIAGGSANTASGPNAAIGGGGANHATASSSTVAGGNGNRAEGIHSFIGGGIGNIASGQRTAISGGGSNRARGNFSTIGGGGGFAFADSNSAMGLHSTIGGGRSNIAVGDSSTIAGGSINKAAGMASTVGGGQQNIAEGMWSTIGGGYLNKANADLGFVGGGRDNTAGNSAVVVGGSNNGATGYLSVVGGGAADSATGQYATVPGGLCNSAKGILSFAAGNAAKANHASSFVWNGTSSCVDSFTTTADRQFLVRAFRVGINTNTPATTFDVNGDIHASGAITATTCCAPSDTRFKQDIGELRNPLETVERLHGVRYQWNREQFPNRDFAQGEQIGLLAQEVRDVVPQAVHEMGDGYLAVDYSRLVPLLIESIKAQQKQIDDLKSRLDRQTP